MRLAARLAAREVLRRKGRTALVVALVAITVAGLTAADLGYRSHNLPDRSNFGAADVRLTENASVAGATPSASLDDVLRELPIGAASVAGAETYGLPVQRADRPGLGVEVMLTTLDLSNPVLSGATVVRAGRLAAAPDQVTLGSAIADRLSVGVGDSLHLVQPDVTFRVVGIADLASGDSSLFNAPGFPVELLTPGAATNVAYVEGVPENWYPSNGNAAFLGIEYPPTTREPAPEEILIAWLSMTLLLGVLGIVIAAAFAASGRRQLVTLGQLGATGADAGFARRFLALQGSATSLLGSIVGVTAGVVVAALVGDPLLRNGEWDVRALDLALISVTAVVVGTIAALLPTRSLATAPVLAALAGRSPVKSVRPWQVPLGVAAVLGGLGALGLSVSSVANGGGDTLTIVIALFGAGTVLAGVCALSPVVVDRWVWIGGRGAGTIRLAVRSMVRHRARSAALVAAVAAVGAAGVAGASGIERWSQLDRRNDIPAVLDVVTLGWDGFGANPGGDADVPSLTAELDELRTDVDQIVPAIAWSEATWKYNDNGEVRFVADDATLTALGVPEAQWAAVRTRGDALVARFPEGAGANVVVPTLRIYMAPTVSPATVASAPDEWHELSPVWIGVAPSDLTDAQRQQLTAASFGARYTSWYSDVTPGTTRFTAGFEYPPSSSVHVTRAMARWLVVLGLLLLVTIIVSIGLALWAAEGRVERDQLIAVGAPPAALARMAGARAWIISTTGGLIAVPLGWVMLWTILRAADKSSPFPTLTAVMVAVAIPIVVAGGAIVSSRVAQAARPITGSTMSLD